MTPLIFRDGNNKCSQSAGTQVSQTVRQRGIRSIAACVVGREPSPELRPSVSVAGVTVVVVAGVGIRHMLVATTFHTLRQRRRVLAVDLLHLCHRHLVVVFDVGIILTSSFQTCNSLEVNYVCLRVSLYR